MSSLYCALYWHSLLSSYSFGYRIVEHWNSLPEEVIAAPTIKIVERRLNKICANQDVKYDFKKCIKILHKNNTPYTNNGTGSENSDNDDLAIEVYYPAASTTLGCTR